MTTKNRVTHFEIPSGDPKKSMQFFGDVFGWQFEQFGDREYWLALSGDDSTRGINGAIMKKVDEGQPLINTITVANIDEMAAKIVRAGGKIVKRMVVEGYGWIAFFSDPDGNMHGIAQEDKNAR